jgi:hypothetical protein
VRVAIYTAITAGKDTIKEPPVHTGVDRILFTDRPDDYAGTVWHVRPACDLFTSPRRNSRAHKILAHQYLEGFDYSLWIDGTIWLRASPLTLIETYLGDADVALFRHPARDCLYVEAEGCARAGYDEPETFAEQVARYRRAGHPEHNGLNECAVILRRHNARTETFNNAWWSEYCRHSCRDQVCVNYVLRMQGVRLALLPGTITDNPEIVYYQGHQHPL